MQDRRVACREVRVATDDVRDLGDKAFGRLSATGRNQTSTSLAFDFTTTIRM